MNGNKTEKALARERMARTGENYTTALAAVRREHAEPRWTTPRDTAPQKDWKDMTPEQRQREIERLMPKGTRP